MWMLSTRRWLVRSSDAHHSPGRHAHPRVARVRGAGVVGEVDDAEESVWTVNSASCHHVIMSCNVTSEQWTVHHVISTTSCTEYLWGYAVLEAAAANNTQNRTNNGQYFMYNCFLHNPYLPIFRMMILTITRLRHVSRQSCNNAVTINGDNSSVRWRNKKE